MCSHQRRWKSMQLVYNRLKTTWLYNRHSAPFERETWRSAMLENELATTCQTIALSLDVWTSKNHIPILGVIGHWLTEEFEYRENVLEFKKLHGPHSGENMAAAIQALLIELNLERKLLSITGDNARKNERMAVELFNSLQKTYGADSLFCGLDSYTRRLAHIINLIVKDICSLLSWEVQKKLLLSATILTKESTRHINFTLWIQRSSQRRQSWNDTCDRMNLSNKFIGYDVDKWWNSTFSMLEDALKVKTLRSSKRQLEKFIYYETSFLSFSPDDWVRFSQIHDILSKINEFTLFGWEKRPQIRLVLPIYCELHDLLHDVAERKYDLQILLKISQALLKGASRSI
ncbi:hypothetical protein N7490_006740 [Penicillium lividum]|nr:hypothetical protein N7490_006740 [Penicillium lividum]